MKLTQSWRKSSKSPPTDNSCLEARFADQEVEIRNSNRLDAGTIRFTLDEWRAFTDGVKLNEFEI